MPTDFPVHVTAPQWSAYYKLYARHFNLYDNITFSVTVSSVRRDKSSGKWMVQLDGEPEPRAFDKVVVASGSETVPMYPKIENIDEFQGSFIHGQAYKR